MTLIIKRIFILVMVVVSGFLLSGCSPKPDTSSPTGISGPNPTQIPEKPVEQTIKERPYVVLTPSADGHWLNLEVRNIVKGTLGISYELVYFADVEGNKLERGVSSGDKPVELMGQTEYSKKILLGSASCTTGTCKYKYDDNVTEGTLTLTLVGPNGKDKYESVYRIQKGIEAKNSFTTGDGTFSLISSSLPAKNVYLIISSVGIPIPLPDGVVPKTVPYTIYPNISGKGTVIFKTSLPEVSVYALTGKTWQKLMTTTENGKASAEFSNVSLFILAQ